MQAIKRLIILSVMAVLAFSGVESARVAIHKDPEIPASTPPASPILSSALPDPKDMKELSKDLGIIVEEIVSLKASEKRDKRRFEKIAELQEKLSNLQEHLNALEGKDVISTDKSDLHKRIENQQEVLERMRQQELHVVHVAQFQKMRAKLEDAAFQEKRVEILLGLPCTISNPSDLQAIVEHISLLTEKGMMVAGEHKLREIDKARIERRTALYESALTFFEKKFNSSKKKKAQAVVDPESAYAIIARVLDGALKEPGTFYKLQSVVIKLYIFYHLNICLASKKQALFDLYFSASIRRFASNFVNIKVDFKRDKHGIFIIPFEPEIRLDGRNFYANPGDLLKIERALEAAAQRASRCVIL